MFVTFIAPGMPGDVQPLMALARGFQDAGHTVRVATHPNYEKSVTQAGLEFTKIAGDTRLILTDPAFLKVLEADHRPDRMIPTAWSALRDLTGRVQWQSKSGFRALFQLARWYDGELMENLWSATADSDALVYGASMALHGYYAARERGIPSALAFIQTRHPLDYNAASPPFYGDFGKHAGWQIFRESIVRWQRKSGYATAPFRGPFAQWQKEQLPIVYGLSPSVLPESGSWVGRQNLSGYWFLDSAPGSSLPAEVRDFLAADPPPVYITFGSMATVRPRQMTDLVTSALRRTGDRGIIATAWGGFSETANTESLLCVDELPLDLVFPHVRAVVHHGGMMTTAEGLRAGRPTVIIPSVLDQFDWGTRVEELGVGKSVPRKQLTAAKLADALASTRDPRMVSAAAELGTRIRAERGVERTVEVLDRIFTRERAIQRRNHDHPATLLPCHLRRRTQLRR